MQKINWTACLYSFYSIVYLARFSNYIQSLNRRERDCINQWSLMNEQKQPLKQVFCKKQMFISNYRRCSIKNRCSLAVTGGVLTNFSKFTGNTCARLKLQASPWNFLKKETLTREFFCEFCDIFESNLFTEHLWMTVSRYSSKYLFYHGSTEYQADCMIKIFKKCQWRSSVLVNLQAYSQQL